MRRCRPALWAWRPARHPTIGHVSSRSLAIPVRLMPPADVKAYVKRKKNERLRQRRKEFGGDGRMMRLCLCVHRTAGVMTTLMRSDRDPRLGKPVKRPRDTRAHAFGWDPISGSHQGQRLQRLHRNGGHSSMQKQAGYMAAPERFAESQIPLAPRAPSIHERLHADQRGCG